MAVTLPFPRPVGPHRSVAAPAPRHRRAQARAVGRHAWREWCDLLPGLTTVAVSLAAVGYLAAVALDAPSSASAGPVAVEVSGVLDTAGLVRGGVTASDLVVRNTGGADARWSWRPLVVGSRAATGALTVSATLGSCARADRVVVLAPGRDAPRQLAPGGLARLCVRLALPAEVAGPGLGVTVRVDARPA